MEQLHVDQSVLNSFKAYSVRILRSLADTLFLEERVTR